MKKAFLLIIIAVAFFSCGKEVQPSFNLDKEEVMVGETVQFTNTSSGAVYYNWKFGDGGSSRLENPSHIFLKAGTYQVHLHVMNKGGDRWADFYHEVRVRGYQTAFLGNWTMTEAVTSDSCGSGPNIYNMMISSGDQPDEVSVSNFAGLFQEPIVGHSPYGDPSKIEFNVNEATTYLGQVYNINGNIVINNNSLTILYNLTPAGSGPTICGNISATGTGISY